MSEITATSPIFVTVTGLPGPQGDITPELTALADQVAADKDAAAASATLAGHYANDDTDTDVPGGAPGDRGSKYWATVSEAWAEGHEPGGSGTKSSKEWAQYAENIVEEIPGQIAAIEGEVAAIDAYAGTNRNLIDGVIREIGALFARIEDIENDGGGLGSPWVSGAAILDGSATASFNGAVVEIAISDAHAGGVFDSTKASVLLWRKGFLSDQVVNPPVDGYDDANLTTLYQDLLSFNHVVRVTAPSTTGLTLPGNPLDMDPDEPVSGGKAYVRGWLSDIVCAADNQPGYEPVLVLRAGWYVNGSFVAPAQRIVLTNNSTAVSPKAPANLISEYKTIVGDTLTGEIAGGFHYFGGILRGQQLAAVEVRATDGTSTVKTVVYRMAKSPRATDQQAVLCYPFSLDISSLADNALITLNWRTIPLVGTSASIFDSADLPAGTPEPGPRHFWRNTSLAANPRVIYISSSGNDSTCVASTNDAAARAAPALTVKGAIEKAQTTFAGSGGAASVRYRAQAGTWTMATPTPQTTSKGMAMIFENDPLVDPATVIYEFATFSPKANATELFPGVTRTAMAFDGGVKVKRTAASSGNFSSSITSQDLFWWNVSEFDNNSVALTYLSNTNDYWYGGPVLNGTQQALGVGGNRHGLWRGLIATGASTTSPLIIALTHTYGSLLTRVTHVGASTQAQDYITIAFSKYFDVPDAGAITIGSTSAGVQDSINHVCIVQNFFERLSGNMDMNTTRFSGDKFRSVLTHFVHIGNTYVGAYLNGRRNCYYDETLSGWVRNHRWVRDRNNIDTCVPMKSDFFLYVTAEDQANAHLHTGNWQQTHGVGMRDNLCQYTITLNARPENFGPGTLFPPPGTYFTPSRIDPGFVDDRGVQSTNPSSDGVTAVYVSGSAGGDYHIAAGGLARTIEATPLLPYDLDGEARSFPDCVGCFN